MEFKFNPLFHMEEVKNIFGFGFAIKVIKNFRKNKVAFTRTSSLEVKFVTIVILYYLY